MAPFSLCVGPVLQGRLNFYLFGFIPSKTLLAELEEGLISEIHRRPRRNHLNHQRIVSRHGQSNDSVAACCSWTGFALGAKRRTSHQPIMKPPICAHQATPPPALGDNVEPAAWRNCVANQMAANIKAGMKRKSGISPIGCRTLIQA